MNNYQVVPGIKQETSLSLSNGRYLPVTTWCSLLMVLFFTYPLNARQFHNQDFPIVSGTVNALHVAEAERLLFIGGEFRYIGESSGHGVFYRKSDLSRVKDAPRINRSMLMAAPDGTGGIFINGEFRRVGDYDRRRLARIRSDLTVSPNFDPSPGSSIEFLPKPGNRLYAVGLDWVAQVNTAGIGVRMYPNVLDYYTLVFDIFNNNIMFMSGRYRDENNTIREGVFRWDLTANSPFETEHFFINTSRFNVRQIEVVDEEAYILISNNLYKYHDLYVDIDLDWIRSSGDLQSFIVYGEYVYLLGRFFGFKEDQAVPVVRVSRDTGEYDDWYLDVNGSVYGMYVTSAGHYLVLMGDFDEVDGVPVKDFAMYTLGISIGAGSRVRNFHPRIPFRLYDERYESELTFAETSNHYFIGGGFYMVDTHESGPFAVLDMDTGEVIELPYIIEGRITTMVRDGDLLLIGGDIRFWEEGYQNERYGVIAFDIPGRRLASWFQDLYYAIGIRAIAATDQHVFVGGDFYYIYDDTDYIYRDNLFSLNRQTGAFTDWAPEVDGPVSAAVVHNGVLYVAGSFGLVNGQERNNLAAFDADSGDLLDWNPGTDGPVNTLLVHNDMLYIGGNFQLAGGEPRNRIAAFDLFDGSLTGWKAEADREVFSIHISGNTLYAGAGSSSNTPDDSRLRAYSLELDENNRIDWPVQIHQSVRAIHVADDTGKLYIGGDFHEMGDDYIRRGMALVDAPDGSQVSIRDDRHPGQEARPASFVLHPNYPNPFNPSTEIRFNLPESEHVTLSVWDPMGRKVATLINTRLGAGEHSATFGAGHLSGGVYIYRLIAGSSRATGKMMLVK